MLKHHHVLCKRQTNKQTKNVLDVNRNGQREVKSSRGREETRGYIKKWEAMRR